jgi:hypothetical protein
MTGRLLSAAAAAVLLLAACGDDKAPPSGADDVFEAWRNAGLTVGPHDALDNSDTLGGGSCQRGEVDGIETTVCGYESEDAARAAQPAGLDLVGDATGASLPRGKVLLVVADRGGSDPSGKKIHQLTKAFLGK